MTTSGSQTATYAYTNNTTEVTVAARVTTQSEQIARYFTEDLQHFLYLTHIDLMKELQLPPDNASSSEEVVEMLYDDLTHMLREGLITGIHLLLSDPKPDRNSNAYLLRYHAMYVINQKPESRRSLQNKAERFGGLVSPPEDVWINANFALLIDWNPVANERRHLARRPRYCFDWVPEHNRFDATSLVRYREGGMTFNGATVVERREARSPHFS